MINKSITLKVDNLNIAGQLYLPDSDNQYPTVCVCHGIPAGVPDPGDRGYPLLAERICREGFAVFIFNFRGTGASEGNLDILGWTRDLKAVLNYLVKSPEVDKSRLSLLGFSAGAAVSIYLASKDERVTSIIACACPAEMDFSTGANNHKSVAEHFRSIGAIRDDAFPLSIEEWFNGFSMVRPIQCVADIAPRPLLLVHGNQDEVVAVSHAHRLFSQAGKLKQLVIIDGGGHRLRQNDMAVTTILNWLKSPHQNQVVKP